MDNFLRFWESAGVLNDDKTSKMWIIREAAAVPFHHPFRWPSFSGYGRTFTLKSPHSRIAMPLDSARQLVHVVVD
ncbi:hypothetical protein, partial [Bifidobacterium vansinderenii]|uniref:hypothetical protein n=1 Tax=Bifidobacterium vansinderenii TaxID=1984871 RepID=UPI001E46575D